MSPSNLAGRGRMQLSDELAEFGSYRTSWIASAQSMSQEG